MKICEVFLKHRIINTFDIFDIKVLNRKSITWSKSINMQEKILIKRITLIQMLLHFDYNKCTGCKVCELICSFHHYNFFSTSFSRIHIFNDYFLGIIKPIIVCSAQSLNVIIACPINAIYIDEKTGAKIIDTEKCDACGKCAEACPYNKEGFVLRMSPNKQSYHQM